MSCAGVLQRNTTSSRYMYINIYHEDLAPAVLGLRNPVSRIYRLGPRRACSVIQSESKGLRARGANGVKLPE